jgi:outer membrane receptor protein involved in Fe transport
MLSFKTRFLRLSGICAILALSLETAVNADVLASWDVWNGAEGGVKPLAINADSTLTGISAFAGGNVVPAFPTVGGGHKAAFFGSTDGTFGDLGSPAADTSGGMSNFRINLIQNNTNNNRLDITLTNNTGSDIQLDAFYFDYNPTKLASQIVQLKHLKANLGGGDFTSDLDDANGDLIGSFNWVSATSWTDASISLSSGLTDSVLADGESVAFRIEIPVTGDNSGTAFAIDNVAITGTLPALAQETSDIDDEIFELSPFEVSTEGDIGYIASSTLAGSRLNTRLEDVAATVTVVTKELMEDIGATDAGSLLTYTAGTEVSGTRGNFTNATNNGQGVPNDIVDVRSGGQGTRVRGLAAADSSRNYFQSRIPFDSYNTDRIEINRGSNAVLFGLGSPAGIINNSTLKPVFRDLNRIRFTADSFGRLRGEFNVNREIFKNVLAVRFAGVRDNRKFEQDDAFRDMDRLYIAALFQKNLFGKRGGFWGRTIINASYEDGKQTSNNPRTTPPQDLITPWFHPYTQNVLGSVNMTPKPVWDAQLARLYGSDEVGYHEASGPVNSNNVTMENPALQVRVDPNWQTSLTLMFPDPTSSVPMHPAGVNIIAANGRLGNWPTGTINRTGSALYPFNGTVPTLRDSLEAWTGIDGTPDSVSGAVLWRTPVVTDRSIFDFRKEMIDGPNLKREGYDFDVSNFSIQQLFFDGKAGIEYAVADETWENYWSGPIGWRSYLTLDINKVLVDGTENPNFGRPFVISGAGSDFYSKQERTTERVTAFMDIDLRDQDNLFKWLGRHVITGMVSQYEQDSYQVNYANGWDPAFIDTNLGIPLEPDRWGESTVASIHYLGDSIADMSTPAGANIQGIQANQVPSNDMLSSSSQVRVHPIYGNVDTFSDGWRNMSAPSILNVPYDGAVGRRIYDAQAVILQSYLLKDHLVGTLSWRKDKVDVRDINSAPQLPDESAAIVDPAIFNVDGITDEQALISEKETTTYGLIGKVPDSFLNWTGGFITAVHGFYNESENFQPGGQRYDATWNPLPPPSGETKDYGIRIRMLNDKLTFKVTKYETSQLNVSGTVNNWTIWFSSQMVLGNLYRSAASDINGGRTEPGKGGYRGNLGYVEGTQHIRKDTDFDGVQDVVLPAPPQYWMDWYNIQYDPARNDGYTFTDPGGSTHTQNVEAEGLELELVYNPTPNWRIAFNATRQEAVQTGAGEAFANWLDNEPFFDSDLDGTPDLSLRDGIFGPYSEIPRQASRTTFLPWVFTDLIDPWNASVFVTNGQPAPELSEWKWNLITNYKFTNGPLKGFNMGGSIQYQKAAGIGYGVKDDNEAEPDFDKAIYGDDYVRLQLWFGYTKNNLTIFNSKVSWSIRLNIRNVLNDRDLIPIQANPDGEITGVRIGEPRLFEIVNTFNF